MKNKRKLITILICLAITFALAFFSIKASIDQANATVLKADSVAVKPVSSQIVTSGSITAQNQATLHFQTGGKLVYLPFKEGDSVSQGQTIAQLDTYQLQRQLTQALNTYRSTRDTFDQSNELNSAGALSNQQSTTLHTSGAGIGGDTNTNVVNDTVRRIVDENQANLDNSVINVELANYAMQLSTLTSPLTGIITHEDVNVANQNIGTATSILS